MPPEKRSPDANVEAPGTDLLACQIDPEATALPRSLQAFPDSSDAAITLRDAALACARNGWLVLPCSPATKHPLLPRNRDADGKEIPGTGGLCKATADAATIVAWWRRWPRALIGLRTGRFVVVDLDVRNDRDGIAEFAKLVARWGAVPQTLRVRTPRGGLHLYFSAPTREIRNSTSRIAPGVDVRGEGGYVIAAGSVLSDGRVYRRLRGPTRPAEMPGWLTELACPPPPLPIASPVVVAADAYAVAVLNGEIDAIAAAPVRPGSHPKHRVLQSWPACGARVHRSQRGRAGIN